jgi:hypothetical protein
MPSFGQTLYHDFNIRQAVCFSASCFQDNDRLAWTDSFAKKVNRGEASKIKASSMLLVISQNCDIAARKDELDSAIEIVVCKKLKIRNVFEGNKFAHSSRKLQFYILDSWYEANVDYIITIEKVELLTAIQQSQNFTINLLSKEYSESVPVWRANRYLRSGLPDSFNEFFFPVLEQHIEQIEAEANIEQGDYSSYIRAMFIKVAPLDESPDHIFELFALLRDSVDDITMSKIQDAIECMAEAVVDSSAFNDNSMIYADREKNTTVSYLNGLLKLNLDYHSLSNGDGDIGPEKL